MLGLPGGVVDLAVHQLFLFHLVHDDINFLVHVESVDDFLVFSHVFVDEIQTSGYDLQLVDYLLQLEGHHLCDFLGYNNLYASFLGLSWDLLRFISFFLVVLTSKVG